MEVNMQTEFREEMVDCAWPETQSQETPSAPSQPEAAPNDG